MARSFKLYIVVLCASAAVLTMLDHGRSVRFLTFLLQLSPWLAPVVFAQITSGPGPGPLRYTPRRWMQFVDGENLTIRAQRLIGQNGIDLKECDEFKRDCFIVPFTGPHKYGPGPLNTEPQPVRAYYYTSLVGDDPMLVSVRTQLWNCGFEPHVFKKNAANLKTKGVDIQLTNDMLSHAFRDNYDSVVLIAGDGDYVPLIQEVKRLGKQVNVHFIDACSNLELRLAADKFTDITPLILAWARQTAAAQSTVPTSPG